jgi:hypothetical protein
MTVEELYNFGKSQGSQRFYHNHYPEYYYKVIQKHFVAKASITAYANFYIPDLVPKTLPYYSTLYPHHKALLQPEHQEAIMCNSCEGRVLIFRHIPRISSALVLSNKFSTYHPQSSQSCNCGKLSVIVSHKGIPHIYSDDTFTLITYFNSQEIRHGDPEFTYSELPKELNMYLTPNKRDPWEPTCSISLRDLNKVSELGMIIPLAQTYGSTIPYNTREHLRRYAYTFSLLIYTRQYIYLPNGVIVNTSIPVVREWLSQAPEALEKMPKYSKDRKFGSMFSALANHNKYAEMLNEFLCNTFSLPLTPLKYYPKNTITYQQYIQPNHSHTPYYNFRLKRLKRQVARLARQVLLSNNLLDIARYTKDHYPAVTPLKLPPALSYYQTFKISVL